MCSIQRSTTIERLSTLKRSERALEWLFGAEHGDMFVAHGVLQKYFMLYIFVHFTNATHEVINNFN